MGIFLYIKELNENYNKNICFYFFTFLRLNIFWFAVFSLDHARDFTNPLFEFIVVQICRSRRPLNVGFIFPYLNIMHVSSEW